MRNFTSNLLAVFICFAIFSCSNDDDGSETTDGDLTISGKVMSPGNAFPISRAKVKVFQNGELIAEQVSDAIGNFSIENLPEGETTVRLSKGKFMREVSLNLQNNYILEPNERNLDVFPTMVVVPGAYDDIEQVLVNIGVVDASGAPAFDIVLGGMGRMMETATDDRHTSMARASSMIAPNVTFTFNDLIHNPSLLANYDIVFLNCGATSQFASDPVAIANLREYVENGGIIYATDWMYKYLQPMFASENYLNFSLPEKGGDSLQADVVINNADLTIWLESLGLDVTPTIEINGFLGSWQMVNTFADGVDDWLIAEDVMYDGVIHNDKAMAYTFRHGCGGVFYSSFHTHGNNASESTIEQMMNYFIFELSDLALPDCGGSSN